MCATRSYAWYVIIGSDHYDDMTMNAMASQIISLTIVYSIVYSDADQRKHQSSASLAFVLGIHRGPVNSPDKWPVTRKMSPFDDIIMYWLSVINKFSRNICQYTYIFDWNAFDVHHGINMYLKFTFKFAEVFACNILLLIRLMIFLTSLTSPVYHGE